MLDLRGQAIKGPSVRLVFNRLSVKRRFVPSFVKRNTMAKLLTELTCTGDVNLFRLRRAISMRPARGQNHHEYPKYTWKMASHFLTFTSP